MVICFVPPFLFVSVFVLVFALSRTFLFFFFRVHTPRIFSWYYLFARDTGLVLPLLVVSNAFPFRTVLACFLAMRDGRSLFIRPVFGDHGLGFSET